MQNIKSTNELKNAIQILEVEQAEKGQMLKEQFFHTYESFRPVNLLKSILNDIATSPHLIDNILSTGLGLATGFLSKKIFVGGSGNKLRKVIGSVLQFSVINFVAKHQNAFNTIGRFFFQKILRKKEIDSSKL